MAESNAFRNQWLSLKPAIAIGTSAAPGSASASHDSIVSASGDRVGERLPTTCSTNSISKVAAGSPALSPSTALARSRTSASPMPGGTRQSTRISACEGITFAFSDARATVGTNVTLSIGSTR